MFIRRQFDYDGSVVVKELAPGADAIAEMESLAQEHARQYQGASVQRRDEGDDFGEPLDRPHFDIIAGETWLETFFATSD